MPRQMLIRRGITRASRDIVAAEPLQAYAILMPPPRRYFLPIRHCLRLGLSCHADEPPLIFDMPLRYFELRLRRYCLRRAYAFTLSACQTLSPFFAVYFTRYASMRHAIIVISTMLC